MVLQPRGGAIAKAFGLDDATQSPETCFEYLMLNEERRYTILPSSRTAQTCAIVYPGWPAFAFFQASYRQPK